MRGAKRLRRRTKRKYRGEINEKKKMYTKMEKKRKRKRKNKVDISERKTREDRQKGTKVKGEVGSNSMAVVGQEQGDNYTYALLFLPQSSLQKTEEK